MENLRGHQINGKQCMSESVIKELLQNKVFVIEIKIAFT